MTAEIYEKMKAYVADGGRLILSVAHLNTQDKRGEEIQLLNDGRYSDFLGFDVVGLSTTNDGVKFRRDGLAEGVQYPGTDDFICDCNFCRGYAEYAFSDLHGLSGGCAGMAERCRAADLAGGTGGRGEADDEPCAEARGGAGRLRL
jgi:hypothetical protein